MRAKGVKTPTVPVRPRKIITPEQFELLHAALRGEEFQLLVETDIGADAGSVTHGRTAVPRGAIVSTKPGQTTSSDQHEAVLI